MKPPAAIHRAGRKRTADAPPIARAPETRTPEAVEPTTPDEPLESPLYLRLDTQRSETGEAPEGAGGELAREARAGVEPVRGEPEGGASETAKRSQRPVAAPPVTASVGPRDGTGEEPSAAAPETPSETTETPTRARDPWAPVAADGSADGTGAQSSGVMPGVSHGAKPSASGSAQAPRTADGSPDREPSGATASAKGEARPSASAAPADSVPTAAPVASEDPGAVLTSLAAAAPSQLVGTFGAATAASSEALGRQRDATAASLPEIPTPTGMAPSEHARPDAADGVPGATDGITEGLPPPTTPEPPTPEAGAPELPPPPAAKATRLAEGQDADADSGDPTLAASARASLSAVRLPPAGVPTATTPAVPLEGEADPTRVDDAEAAARSDVGQARDAAQGATQADFGEQAIAPAPDASILRPSTPLRDPPTVADSTAEPPALPAAAYAGLDAEAAAPLDAALAAERDRYAEGQAGFERDRAAALDDADGQIASAESDAAERQRDARRTAIDEVDGARADWQQEIETVDADARTAAEESRAEHTSRIDEERTSADREAAEHMREAEADAAAKTAEADREAAQKKQEAEEESDGFWGWVKAKAKAFIDGLKSVVNAIYDGLRAAVKAIFDAAKAIALGVIELARKVIVGLIAAFGEALKLIVRTALAAFPKLADKFCGLIDRAVERATAAVNTIAEGLKTAVAAIIDFVASTIDGLLSLVQGLYNACFTIIGMLVTGEWKAILKGVSNLIEAAKLAPDLFEIAAYEELLGGDLDQPLPAQTLIAAGRTPPTTEGGSAGVGAPSEMPQPPWSTANVGVDPVADDFPLSPELAADILARTGGDGAVEFGHSDDADRDLSAMLGVGGPEAAGPAPSAAAPEAIPDDGLTPQERAEVKWTLMKKGLAEWWDANWPFVLAGGILAVVGFIAANILTGGAVLAAVPVLLSALGPLFAGLAALQLAKHLGDYLEKGWAGDLRGGGKSLAKGLAAAAIELLSWLTFKVGGAALKGAKAAAKGVAKGAQTVARGASRAGRTLTSAGRRAGQYVVKQGKVLLRGVARSGIGRAAKRLDDFGKRLLAKTRFKGFRVRVQGRWFVLEGKVNPWVKLAEGRLVEVDGPQAGAIEVDDVAVAQARFDTLRALRRQGDEASEAWKARARKAEGEAFDRAHADTDPAFKQAELADRFHTQGGKIDELDRIAANDATSLRNWEGTKEMLERHLGISRERFWKPIEEAWTAREVDDAIAALNRLDKRAAGFRNANHKKKVREIVRNWREKLAHKQRRLAAQQKKLRSDDELIDEILTPGTKDVYANSRAQAERIQDALEAADTRAPTTQFHGPEAHRGHGTAPEDLHFNVEGHLNGVDYKVHIYYPR